MDFLYHLFPLGALDAPHHSSDQSEGRLHELTRWIPYLKDLGCDAVLMGPVFQSESNGYDVVDPYTVDRRLGTNADLTVVARAFREAGISVVLDAVFNHVGRSFFAFQDLLHLGRESRYRQWFSGIDFSKPSPLGDPFSYDTWDGHASLVKLNLENDEVLGYLLKAVRSWIDDFGITGLRLDAADVITPSFWPRLRDVTGPDMVLIGEMVHGDYSTIVGPDKLNGATNYECYKGLYSSFNDNNLFEIAWSLNRQSGPDGIYRNVRLLNFADNHDVPRIASTVVNSVHLYPLHILLFTMPGIPSIYYGSEVGIEGVKGIDDWNLRPPLDPADLTKANVPHPGLRSVVRNLAALRKRLPTLKGGSYRQVHVSDGSLGFVRSLDGDTTLVVINGTDEELELPLSEVEPELRTSGSSTAVGVDYLNGDARVDLSTGKVAVPPNWGRVIQLERAADS